MPPKTKYTKDDLLNCAVDLVRLQGSEKLTARELAATLGCSTKPIFACFASMEDLTEQCWNKCLELFYSFDPEFPDKENGLAATRAGRNYIAFAQKEPNLFKFIFLQNQDTAENFPTLMKRFNGNYKQTLRQIADAFSLSIKNAEVFYKDIWLFSHGIACMCAFNQCRFTYREISTMLEQTGAGLITLLRDQQ